jgi:NTP pyrophosphatase (non-canonical NTP hydrolase)
MNGILCKALKAEKIYQNPPTNTMTKKKSLKKLRINLAEFVIARNWEQFHSPKNLAMALSVEAAELMEIFQWMESSESRTVDSATRDHIEEEIGDVMIYLTMLADKFDLDPIEAAHKKMVLNAVKYPVNP